MPTKSKWLLVLEDLSEDGDVWTTSSPVTPGNSDPIKVLGTVISRVEHFCLEAAQKLGEEKGPENDRYLFRAAKQLTGIFKAATGEKPTFSIALDETKIIHFQSSFGQFASAALILFNGGRTPRGLQQALRYAASA